MTESMTGFGRADRSTGRYQFGVEIKSTNHRFLDIKIRLPRELAALEADVRRAIRNRFARGSVDLRVALERTAASRRFVVEEELFSQAAAALEAAGRRLKVESPVDLATLAQFGDLFRFENEPDDEAELAALLNETVEAACDELALMRRQEGAEIIRSVRASLERLEETAGLMEAEAPRAAERLRESCRERIAGLLGEQGVAQERVAQEAALLAMRSDVTEEIARLRGHLQAFAEAAGAGGAVGRRMDFLVQEMHRELNTLGAKAGGLDLAHLAIQGKLEAEKIKEQIQNLQ